VTSIRTRAASVAARWRAGLAAHATDARPMLAGRTLMVLAPHADDETFGCGALIARARAAGTAVTVVVATDGARCATSAHLGPEDIAALRRGELRDACGRLGVPTSQIIELGYGDGTLTDHRAAVTERLAELIAARRPDVVLAPCPQDQHPDHRALHDAATAVPLAGAQLLLGYPVWTWYSAPFFLEAPPYAWPALWWWAARQRRSRAWLRVPTAIHLAAKRRAVDAYVSQTTNLTGEPGWSYLPERFVAMFLGPDELFVPLQATRAAAPSDAVRATR
jgi:LmbE family N-acetylglucosaminyl deacetylase